MKNYLFSKNKSSVKRILTTILLFIFFILPIYLSNLPSNFGNAHSQLATPMEIFSLWNDTAPTINGKIKFNATDLSKEWTAAAVYDMYDSTESPNGKLFLQNDDTNLYIGMDMTEYQTNTNVTAWGCAVYLDRDHNGILTSYDRRVILLVNESGSLASVHFDQFRLSDSTWIEIETGSPGVLLPNNVIADTSFYNSFFESTNHRQYEVRIPLSLIGITTGNITGFGVEAFTNLAEGRTIWPWISATPSVITNSAEKWGDLHLGRNSTTYAIDSPYVFESNLNIRPGFVGPNNGTFLATGDIDGDGDQELIVGLNRSITGQEKALAIYNYSNGQVNEMWCSISSSYTLDIVPMGIATYDFDNNSEDEIYICSDDTRILRLDGWNADDFSSIGYIRIHSTNLMGYIDIGDADNDGNAEIVYSDDNGDVTTLSYSEGTFLIKDTHTPGNILGSSVSRIHAVKIADSDNIPVAVGEQYELLYLAQYSTDDSLSPTALAIMEYIGIYFSNPSPAEDDLPTTSSITTADNFGHTILVEDVDNDGENETIIVGKYSIRIFGPDNFTDSQPPIRIGLNDNTSHPIMAGGATVGDIDDDGKNELVIGFNNGTLMILNVTDSGSDNLSFKVEWKSDIGASPGYRESMTIFDFDNDGENELIIGDNFGQIIVLGKSDPPSVSITSPSYGAIKRNTDVLVTWAAVEDLAMHHYDIYVNSSFIARVGGSMTGLVLPLAEYENYILVNGYDVSGKNDSATTMIFVNLNAPEITITDPENNHYISATSVDIQFTFFDHNGDFDHYTIYRNGTITHPSLDSSTTQATVDLPINGKWNITVAGVDAAANIGRDSIYVNRDTENPIITITSPLDGDGINTTTKLIEYTASDLYSNIDYFEIWRDNTLNATTDLLSQIISFGIDKDYFIEVRAYDIVGNMGTDSIIITKDTVNPTVNITSPVNIEYTTQTLLHLEWDCNDNVGGIGLGNTKVTVNGTQVYFGTNKELDNDLVSDGVKDILVTAYDLAGNSAQDLLTIIVDRENPFIDIISPVDNYNTSQNDVTIYWNSSDLGVGIKQYFVYFNSVLYEMINNSDINYAIVSIPADQTSTITIRAIDYLDHLFEDSVKINHDSSTAEIVITNPIPPHLYSSSPIINFNWIIANVVGLSGFEIYLNETLNDTLGLAIKSYEFNLSTIPIDEFPLFNITILAIAAGVNYTDMRWVTVDQYEPIISIKFPANDSVITDNIIHLEWDSTEEGTGIKKYIVKINDIIINTWTYLKNSQYILLNQTHGYITITVDVVDMANNYANDTIFLQVYLILPEYSVNLASPFYIVNGTFDFDITVSNARSGVKHVSVYIDGDEAFTYSYLLDIQMNPFILPISVTELDYTTSVGLHSLTIVVIDSYDRENATNLVFYIDNEDPGFLGVTINDQSITDSSSGVLDVEVALDATNITIEIIATDNLRIRNVTLLITGDDYNQLFVLTPTNDSTEQLGVYILTLNLTDLPFGQYALEITVNDFAGNEISQTYNINLIQTTVTPWILQGNNLIYVSVGAALFVLLTILFSTVLRKQIANMGWKNEIVTVAYIMNGLPCVYIINEPESVKGDLLFGGAMTGIRGVLEEITGEKSKLKIQSVEIGQKKVLICPGNYGDSVLMVNKIKPIYKDKIIEFTKAFEHDYEYLLKQDDLIITPETFKGANILVQIHFGLSDSMELIDECEDEYEDVEFSSYSFQTQPTTDSYDYEHAAEYLAPQEETVEPTYKPTTEPKEFIIEEETIPQIEEIKSIEKLINLCPKDKQLVFGRIIQNTQSALSALLERQFDIANNFNTSTLEKLEVLLTSEEMPKQMDQVLKTIFSIMQEIFKAIDAGLKGRENDFIAAAEKGSDIWLKEITEKW
ncbi:MAG: hypothetical protein HZR80_10430 [Candidatus Heimdallarchaeota archaeon]